MMLWAPVAILIATLLAATTRRAFGSRFPEKDAAINIKERDLTATPQSRFTDWVWPLLGIEGSRPFISDGFHPKGDNKFRKGR